MLTRPRAVSLAASCAIAALTGCTDLGQHGFGGAAATRDANSVLSIVTGPSPQEAAAWMIDAYDADKRYRGTLLIANALGRRAAIPLHLPRQTQPRNEARVRALALRRRPIGPPPPSVASRSTARPKMSPSSSRRSNPRTNTSAGNASAHCKDSTTPSRSGRSSSASTRAKRTIPISAPTPQQPLGQYAENRVLDGLFAALNDRDLAVNTAALNSLRTLTGQDLGFNRRQWVVWAGQTEAHFAGRTPYEYPVFHRDPGILEIIVPWMHVPNEVAAAPVGMTAQSADTGS